MSRNTSGWGAWHTGPNAPGPCPQDSRFHTVDEAVALNERDSEYRQARMWARHKEWIGHGVHQDDGTLREELLAPAERGGVPSPSREEAPQLGQMPV